MLYDPTSETRRVQRGKGAKRPQSFLNAEKLTGAVVFANVINSCEADYMCVALGGVQFVLLKSEANIWEEIFIERKPQYL